MCPFPCLLLRYPHSYFILFLRHIFFQRFPTCFVARAFAFLSLCHFFFPFLPFLFWFCFHVLCLGLFKPCSCCAVLYASLPCMCVFLVSFYRSFFFFSFISSLHLDPVKTEAFNSWAMCPFVFLVSFFFSVLFFDFVSYFFNCYPVMCRSDLFW